MISILIFLAAISPSTWQGSIESRDAIPHVSNPAHCPAPPARFALEELWRAGGDEADDLLFGLITDVAVDAEGNSYVLDKQLAEITVFSPGGELLRRFGREGEGPGEFRQPHTLFFTPNSELCVAQSMPLRWSLLDEKGNYLGGLPLPEGNPGYSRSLGSPLCRGQALLMVHFQSQVLDGVMDQSSRLISADFSGRELHEYARWDRRMDFAKMIIRERETDPVRWTLGADGRVYVNPNHDYVIEVFGPDGRSERVITREFEQRMRSKAEMRAVNDHYLRGGGMDGVELEIMETVRDIDMMHVTDDGILWVRNSRSRESEHSGSLGVWDLIDPEGRHTGQIELLGQALPNQDRVLIRGDRIFVLRQFADAKRAWQAAFTTPPEDSDEDDLDAAESMSILCYRIPPAAFR